MADSIKFKADLDDGSQREIAITAENPDLTVSDVEHAKTYSLTDVQTDASLGFLEVDHKNKTWSSQNSYLAAYEIKQIGDYILNFEEPGMQ